MRTAVVLGAGGYVGQAFHLGALGALHDTGFDARSAEVLVGTSAGSLVAAAFAAGLSAPDQAAALLGEELSAEGAALRSMPRLSTFVPEAADHGRGPLAPAVLLAAARRPWAVRPGAVVSSLLPAGRHGTERIGSGFRRLLGDRWPDRDLRVCAVRARDARRVVFGTPGAPQVDVGTAVAASCAVPAYFTPVRAQGESYVDGGAHSPSNADVIVRDRAELALVLSPMSYGPGGGRRPRVDTVLRVAVRRYLAAEVRALRRTGTYVVVLQPTPADLAVMGPNPMRGEGVRAVMDSARRSTQARLRAQPDLLVLPAHR